MEGFRGILFQWWFCFNNKKNQRGVCCFASFDTATAAAADVDADAAAFALPTAAVPPGGEQQHAWTLLDFLPFSTER